MQMKKYIASLDVGTTTIRCFIFDLSFKKVGGSTELVQLLNDEPGYFEIEPERLWKSIINVIKNAIADASINIKDVLGLGISTQRSSFITWNRETGEHFHNFITWKDLRADQLVQKWNNSFLLKIINNFSYFLYLITRSKRFLAASVLKMMNSQVTLRLVWQMENNSKLKDAINQKLALFGTLDSWLLYKLRKNSLDIEKFDHISDITSCTATGFFDPFTLQWSPLAFRIFKIREEMLPKVVDNNYNFGYVHKSIFGESIKISSSFSDQSAAMWGSSCFDDGDVKVTLGTGSFLNLNTGKECQASLSGLYPMVGWRFKSGDNSFCFTYCMEGAANDTGTVINWGLNCGLFDDPTQTSNLAESVSDTDGVYFVPAFSGIGPPINDYKSASGFLGIRPSTQKAHMVRALLESIAFRVFQLYECTKNETSYNLKCIRVDGGVSKNNFICQLIADLTNLNVERATATEASVLGSAFVVAFNEGLCTNIKELKKFRKIDRIFEPRIEIGLEYKTKLKVWEDVLTRFKGWYK
ncbi:putative glycerol kinase 5 [Condylostylus longicornis]|uniref:putative glycerol kinase 5 n=1 Tax=Condylostylus longicornis TaxID=2530218 RepID=UPI00244DFB7F|nr:putative glycerol kinase 5 [Condylostylus longicornis]XP_055376206.1 putative glycerol kinase 5 [Condylostylus longicornis]XP_055376207.1 putative glycerol kinase 5 [Condylostylus longicornis]